MNAAHKNHYEETKASFLFNGATFEEIHKEDGSHILVLKDNAEVWFYYCKNYKLIMVRCY